jgi:hypothetical protein
MADKFINAREWGKIFAHAWQNPEFKDQLERDPKSAIASVASDLGIKRDRLYEVPERPADLTDEQLATLLPAIAAN